MTIQYIDDSAPLYWPETDLHNPNNNKFYYLEYRPATRVNSQAYTKGFDVIVLPTDDGNIYECTQSGIAAGTPPTFDTREGKQTADGTVKWVAKATPPKLGSGDAITASTWTSDVGVTLTNSAILNNIATTVRVDAVPAGATQFCLKNLITITRLSGRIERFEKNVIVKIATV